MLRALSFAAGLLLLTSCDRVTVEEPIGEAFSAREKSSLVGTWVDDEGGVMEVHKNKSGDLVVGSMTWDNKENKFKAETFGIVLTTIGRSKYLFVKSDKVENAYEFCRFVRKDDSNVELYLPDPKNFRKVVEESIAIAKVDGSKAIGIVKEEQSEFSIKLSFDSKALLEFFESPKCDACFDNKAILKYKRIRK